MKSMEDTRWLSSRKDIPGKAGKLNLNPGNANEIKQVPGMIAAAEPSDDGFNTNRGVDSLDASGPLTTHA